MPEMISIPKERYQELLQKEEDYLTLAEFQKKRGKRFEHLIFLQKMDQYWTKEKSSGYKSLKKEFSERYEKGYY